MKRMSKEETGEAFGEFAQKAERFAKPKIARAKGCFFSLIGVFVGFLGTTLFWLQTETMGKAMGLGILAFGLFILAKTFLPYRAEKIASGLLFVVVGAVFAYFGYSSYQLGMQSKDWPVAKGSVIQSEIEKRTEFTGTGSSRRKVVKSYAVVKYTYSVGNREFQSGRITFGQSKNAHNTVARYPKGRSIQVHYDPQKPDQAVLEPGADATLSLVFIGLGVVLALIGLRVAAGFWKRAKVLSPSGFS